MARKIESKRVIRLTDRVEVKLKGGQVIETHPANVELYKKKGLIASASKKED